jgi:hypothetical protein
LLHLHNWTVTIDWQIKAVGCDWPSFRSASEPPK